MRISEGNIIKLAEMGREDPYNLKDRGSMSSDEYEEKTEKDDEGRERDDTQALTNLDGGSKVILDALSPYFDSSKSDSPPKHDNNMDSKSLFSPRVTPARSRQPESTSEVLRSLFQFFNPAWYTQKL